MIHPDDLDDHPDDLDDHPDDDLDDHPDDPDERYIKTDTDRHRHRTSSKIWMLYTIGPFGAIMLHF